MIESISAITLVTHDMARIMGFYFASVNKSRSQTQGNRVKKYVTNP